MYNQSRHQSGWSAKNGALAILALILALGVSVSSAQAKRHHSPRRTANFTSLTDPNKDAALILDGISGKVLYARNEDTERHPASLTKLMTLYLLFDALKHRQVTMDTPLTFSSHAAAQKPTNMHVSAGETLTVDTAIRAVVVRSANDVAVVIAEALGGTEAHFAEMMNAKARALGMRNTFFHNASGLPDPMQLTTASDLAILARHLAYDFPQYFHYFASTDFVYRGNRYIGHDNLLGRYDGADGMKTGYTGASGFNLVSSVTRGDTHIIGVVMGGRTALRRDKEMMRLLDNAFDSISSKPALVAHAQIPWRAATHTGTALLASLTPQRYPTAMQPNGIVSDSDDEDSAESRIETEDMSEPANITYPALPMPQTLPQVQPLRATPQPQTPPKAPQQSQFAALKAQPQTAAPKVVPLPAPKPPVMVASIRPAPRATPATPKPALRPNVADAGAPFLGVHDWTIQIGAFGDLNLARAQLAAYAEKSMDVLGQAQRIVVPFQSLDGHWLYRARFGPFLEREARQVCARLTERGQTCFAAISSR